ncbi:helix-turn-helix domain-containing protein [Streptomyces sp. NPDC089919]|uniref:helix-turn-helix domain-containing protein n=1 Tax=Streptomyces sp. NPDC089919 TaxID=3155188 RepID=UPI00342EAC2F
MRIHHTPRRRAFTVLGNDVLRDRRLSFTARGILCYLLSLPDGAHEDARTLADKNPGLGRRGVAKALDELVALGYYVRRTTRDEHTGQVRTDTSVSDTPLGQGAPVPAPPGAGEPVAGKAGRSPQGVENPGEEPSLPEGSRAPSSPPAPGEADAAA